MWVSFPSTVNCPYHSFPFLTSLITPKVVAVAIRNSNIFLHLHSVFGVSPLGIRIIVITSLVTCVSCPSLQTAASRIHL